MALKQSATHYKQKHIYSSLPEHELPDKSEFVTKSVGIILTIIFM